MKSLDQFVSLTEVETLNTNGGGLLDGILGSVGTTVNSLGGPLGSIAVGAGAALILIGSGTSTAIASIGTGAGAFLSKLAVPAV